MLARTLPGAGVPAEGDTESVRGPELTAPCSLPAFQVVMNTTAIVATTTRPTIAGQLREWRATAGGGRGPAKARPKASANAPHVGNRSFFALAIPRAMAASAAVGRSDTMSDAFGVG